MKPAAGCLKPALEAGAGAAALAAYAPKVLVGVYSAEVGKYDLKPDIV